MLQNYYIYFMLLTPNSDIKKRIWLLNIEHFNLWTLGSACETTLVRWWQPMKPANGSVLQARNYQVNSYSDSFLWKRYVFHKYETQRTHPTSMFLPIWHTTNTLVFIPSICNTGISPYRFIFWELDTQLTYYIAQFLTHITQIYHIILIRIM